MYDIAWMCRGQLFRCDRNTPLCPAVLRALDMSMVSGPKLLALLCIYSFATSSYPCHQTLVYSPLSALLLDESSYLSSPYLRVIDTLALLTWSQHAHQSIRPAHHAPQQRHLHLCTLASHQQMQQRSTQQLLPDETVSHLTLSSPLPALLHHQRSTPTPNLAKLHTEVSHQNASLSDFSNNNAPRRPPNLITATSKQAQTHSSSTRPVHHSTSSTDPNFPKRNPPRIAPMLTSTSKKPPHYPRIQPM